MMGILRSLFKSRANTERIDKKHYCYFCKTTINISQDKFYVHTIHSRSILEDKYSYTPESNTRSMAFLCVCVSCAQKNLEGDEFNKECPVCAQEGIRGLSAAMSMGPYY
jgi:hypothetical protein